MTQKAIILDIAMNLNRIGNWAADDYVGKKDRIITFLSNTSGYLEDINKETFPSSFEGILSKFTGEYKTLEEEGFNGPKDTMLWAEKMMTWGNILTHRSKLLDL